MSNRIKAKARFAYKTKTSAEWQSENPVLLNGEVGFVSDAADSNFLKIGDGKTAWNELPYRKGPKGDKGERGESVDISGKLDKIHIEDINSKSDIKKDAFSVFGTHPNFYANIYDENNGNPYQYDNILVRGSYQADSNTVAVRESNGCVNVALPRSVFPENLDSPQENPIGFTLDDLKGPATPLHYTDKRLKFFGDILISQATGLENLNEKTKIISSYKNTQGYKLDLENSSIYVLLHSSGSNNIRITSTNGGNTAPAIDTVSEQLPDFQSGIIIIPKGVTKADGGTDYFQKRCLLVAITGKGTFGIPQTATKVFYYWENDKPSDVEAGLPTATAPNGVGLNMGQISIQNLAASAISIWKI